MEESAGLPSLPVRSLPVRSLKRRSDFLRAGRSGVSWRGTALRLQARKRTGRAEAPARVGYTATKRTIGNAVGRNRARRRLRAAVAASDKNLFVAGSDYVVLALPACQTLPLPQLIAELQDGLGYIKHKLERQESR